MERGSGDERRILYEITDCTQEELLHYLQDSFGIPYWEFMLRFFLQQSVNSRSLSATAVFRVLSSLRIEVLHRRDVIRRDSAALNDNRGEETEALIKAIDAHVAVLEIAWQKDTAELEASELYRTLFQTLEPDQPLLPQKRSRPRPPKCFLPGQKTSRAMRR